MLIFKKIPHYLRTGITLLVELDNPWTLFGYVFHKEVFMKFSNGLRLSSLQFIDPLIIAETVFYDDYRLHEIVEDPKYIIDVGAAMGDFSCWCAQLYPKAEIVAFEPSHDVYELLEKNIKVNNAKNVKPVNLAVSTKPELTFYIATVHVRSSIIKDEFSTTELKVKATPLDKYITKTVDILKIDCEGAEIDILDSIKPASFKKIKRIVLEYHNHLVKDQDKKLTKYLEKYGFEVQQQADEYNANIGYLYGDQK